MTNQIRKLYIDSRIGCLGSPNDFTFLVPSAVSTSVDEGIVISQLNMPNLFQTIMPNFSDKLYFSLNLQDQLGLVTGTNNRLYVRTRIFTPGTGIVFTGYILTIAAGSYATIGAYIAAVQTAFQAVWPTWTIAANGDKYRITTDASITLLIPSFSDLTNPDWIRENWRGPTYDPNATNSANPGFKEDFANPGSWDGEIGIPLTSVVENIAVQLAPGQYSGTDFATLIQVALRSGATTAVGSSVTDITVAYDGPTGKLTISSPSYLLQIYSTENLRDVQWARSVWYNPQSDRHGPALTPGSPQDVNRKMPAPAGYSNSITSAPVDLSGLRELYVHSSLSDYNTLTSGGMRDVIAVITIDQDWGSLVTYRPIGLADQEVLQLADNGLPGSIRIYMTDAFGTPLPTLAATQYVYLQLSIVPYATM
jgi:hypothetical protein